MSQNTYSISPHSYLSPGNLWAFPPCVVSWELVHHLLPCWLSSLLSSSLLSSSLLFPGCLLCCILCLPGLFVCLLPGLFLCPLCFFFCILLLHLFSHCFLLISFLFPLLVLLRGQLFWHPFPQVRQTLCTGEEVCTWQSYLNSGHGNGRRDKVLGCRGTGVSSCWLPPTTDWSGDCSTPERWNLDKTALWLQYITTSDHQ